MQDCFGHTDSRLLSASDGRQVTVFAGGGGERYYYRGHSGPFDLTNLMGIVLRARDTYVVCGYLGESPHPQNVWDVLYAVRELRALHPEEAVV